MEPIKIEFTELGLDPVIQEIIKLANEMREAHKAALQLGADFRTGAKSVQTYAKQLDAATSSAVKFAKASAQAASASARIGSGTSAQSYGSASSRGSSPRTSLKPPRAYVGPAQKSAMADAAWQANMYNPDPNIRHDYFYRKVQANRAYQRSFRSLKPKDPFQDMLATSRVAIGPNGQLQLMPLLNRMVAAGMNPSVGGILNLAQSTKGAGGVVSAAGAGGAGGVGGIGNLAGVGVAAAGIAALAAAAMIAKTRLLDYANTMASTGATGTEAARGMRMGAGLGIDFAGRATAFQGAIGSPGAGMAFARRYGINPFANAYGAGDQDYGGKFIKFLNVILDPKKVSDREAMIAARATGTSDLLYARHASKSVRKDLLASQERAYRPEEIQRAADAQIKMNLAMHDFQSQIAELGMVVLPYVTTLIKGINDLLHPDKIKGQEHVTDWGYGKYGNKPDKEDPGKVIDRAANKMAAAVDKFSGVVDGMYGGSQRARGAVPGGWGPQAFDAQMRGQGINLGAFTGA